MAKIETDRDLAYWLQGYFEISEDSDLPAETLKNICTRINQMSTRGEIGKFVLDTVLENGFEGQGQIIADKLNEVFVHEIDPTIEGDQTELRKIHKGEPKPKIEAMC